MNDIGSISTNYTEICELINHPLTEFEPDLNTTDTTDVQTVKAIGLNCSNGFRLKCDFIHGSDAQGCVVVLVGKFDNVTANLFREGSRDVVTVVTEPYAASCYNEVIAFDIEQDGFVTLLPIPGVLIRNCGVSTLCHCMQVQMTQQAG